MKLNTKSLADVQLGTPLLAETTYFVRIRPQGTKVEPNQKKTGQVLVLVLQILDDEVTNYETNETVSNATKQFTLWHRISLTETFDEKGELKYDPNVRLKELAIACGLPADEDLDLSDILGRSLKVQLKHEPAKDGYSAKNVVSRLLPITDADDFVEPAFG